MKLLVYGAGEVFRLKRAFPKIKTFTYLTRKLFHRDRCALGKHEEAQDLVLEREDQIHAATGHFDRGCYWFHMQHHSRALVELKNASNLYDTSPIVAELTVEKQQEFLERKARCHYVLGLVMMGSTSQMGKAEKEVYRAWRISANYEQMKSISKHAEQLMEVALSFKCGALEAHDRVICIKNSILHEVSADYMYASGNLRLAVGEYRKCLVPEEKESYLCTAQAHVRCKLAMAYQALAIARKGIQRVDLGIQHLPARVGPKSFPYSGNYETTQGKQCSMLS